MEVEVNIHIDVQPFGSISTHFFWLLQLQMIGNVYTAFLKLQVLQWKNTTWWNKLRCSSSFDIQLVLIS